MIISIEFQTPLKIWKVPTVPKSIFEYGPFPYPINHSVTHSHNPEVNRSSNSLAASISHLLRRFLIEASILVTACTPILHVSWISLAQPLYTSFHALLKVYLSSVLPPFLP